MLLFQFYLPLCPPLYTQVSSLCLRLHCCPANRLISTIFLDSMYVLIFPLTSPQSDLLHSTPAGAPHLDNVYQCLSLRPLPEGLPRGPHAFSRYHGQSDLSELLLSRKLFPTTLPTNTSAFPQHRQGVHASAHMFK